MTVHVIDLENPNEEKSTTATNWQEWSNFHVHMADVRDWEPLQTIFNKIGHVDYVFANAGVTESDGLLNFLGKDTRSDGKILEPMYGGLDVNIRGVFNTVKLAYHSMKDNHVAGSVVITGSTAMYIPDEYVPLGSAAWGAVSIKPRLSPRSFFVRLMITAGSYADFSSATQSHSSASVLSRQRLKSRKARRLTSIIRTVHPVTARNHITLNGVAVFTAVSEACPLDIGIALADKGVPVSDPIVVARALIHSAVARQPRRVSTLAGEDKDALMTESRWNGRVIMVMGDKYRELEQLLADARHVWFGKKFSSWLMSQRQMTESIWTGQSYFAR